MDTFFIEYAWMRAIAYSIGIGYFIHTNANQMNGSMIGVSPPNWILGSMGKRVHYTY